MKVSSQWGWSDRCEHCVQVIYASPLVQLCQNFFNFPGFHKSFNAYRNTHAHTHGDMLKLGLRPMRMTISNVVNVALFRAEEEACETLPLISASSCMTGIIRPVFLNEAGCLSSLSSPPLLPANPHPFPPPKKDGWNDLSPRRDYRCLAVCSCLSSASLGRPVSHSRLIVLVSLNHLRGWQEVRKDAITRLKRTPVSASCICIYHHLQRHFPISQE